MKIEKFASGSSGNLYRISDSKTSILIECGLPFNDLKRMLSFEHLNNSAVLISHEHSDHAKSSLKLANSGVNVYTSKGTAEALNINNHWNCCLMKEKVFYNIGTFSVYGFLVNHDAKEPFGFFIHSKENKENLLFITDTYFIKQTFEDVNYLMIEASFDEDIINENNEDEYYKKRLIVSHMSINMVYDYITKMNISKLKEIHLLHLSSKSSNEKMFINKIQSITGVPVYV